MAASANDKLKKYKSLFSTTLSTGIGTGTSDTITPASVAGLPTDTLITLTFDRVDSGGSATPTKLERIQGIVSGGNFTSYTRGIDGTTEQAHTGGAVIEMIWNADDWNDMVDWALVAHNQDGTHAASIALTTPKITTSINDSGGNEVIKTPATESAINEITVTNAATGAGPLVSATGGDTNIDLNFQAKGTGVMNVKATADASSEIRMFEDTDNGSNYVGFKAPTTLSASTTWITPSADGTNGQALVTNGTGTLSWASAGGAGGLTNFLTQYAAGNIIVAPDLTAPYIVQEAITLATVKLYLKDGPNTGATATFVPKRNGKKLFNTAPTIAAPTQKDALDATTSWAGTGVTFANDTSIKKEGTGSLKMTIDATGNRTASKTYGSFSAASPKAITFWIGANAAQTCKFWISDGTNTSYFDIDNVPLVSATNLNFARIYLTSQKLDNPDSNSGTKANIAAITSFGWSSLVASAIYYVDDVEVENYSTGTPDVTALVAGDILSVDCTGIGSTLPGAGLTVEYIKS